VTSRKLDDATEWLYRVAEFDLAKGEWFHTNYWHYGKPRTYTTKAAAKGMKTRMERAAEGRRAFRVEKARIVEWEDASD
jgi:hypothetical protein